MAPRFNCCTRSEASVANSKRLCTGWGLTTTRPLDLVQNLVDARAGRLGGDEEDDGETNPEKGEQKHNPPD